ncbi:hypothetical protein CLOM_g10945 [Closterium sp. NIES-68]|nr:hypothetical protein CLOM_g10945 [Closterium sp. NIES-68]GJP57812.1 hypothetical protein CLOP_g17402 [Closterium sp. NIES-67]
MLWTLWKEAGVWEVNVIGDSHMRGLIVHLWSMHTGMSHNMTLVRHGDISYTLNVTAPEAAGDAPAGGNEVKEGVIRVKYNWLDGIYDNNVAGCTRRGRYSNHTTTYPTPSPTADVTVVGTGHWTFEFCSDGAVAYPHYLPHFLSSLHLLRPKKPAVFFGLPSFWVADRRWIRRTNAMLAYGNGIAQPLARHMGLSYFDTWQVTAPQYRATCSSTDPHYSCPDRNGGMRGEVGEAVVKAFVHFLALQLRYGTQ